VVRHIFQRLFQLQRGVVATACLYISDQLESAATSPQELSKLWFAAAVFMHEDHIPIFSKGVG
jgi:hypothetical protein